MLHKKKKKKNVGTDGNANFRTRFWVLAYKNLSSCSYPQSWGESVMALSSISKLRKVTAFTGNALTLFRRRPLKKTRMPSSRTLTVMQFSTPLYMRPPPPHICSRAFTTSMGVAQAHVTTPATPPATSTAVLPEDHIFILLLGLSLWKWMGFLNMHFAKLLVTLLNNQS